VAFKTFRVPCKKNRIGIITLELVLRMDERRAMPVCIS